MANKVITQFYKDVVTAIGIWHSSMMSKHGTDEYLSDELAEQQANIQEAYQKSEKTDADTLKYYRGLNSILRKSSGACVPEPVGTGDPDTDFQRAMKTVLRSLNK